ncbi:MAG TPA: (d)CMP kinase [Solirubrobacterales bacterium]
MRSSYSQTLQPEDSTLDLRGLLVDLTQAECRFVVIGSSGLALQGWKVSPGDLDVMALPSEVERIKAAIGLSGVEVKPVEDGEARRLECHTAKGPVDIYLAVSGGLAYEAVCGDAIAVLFGDDRLAVSVGSLEHIRDMRAAVGRDSLPEEAVAPAAKPGAPLIVAIDGPGGAGKSTVSRMVSRRLGFTYLNTGAMYRCVTLAVLGSKADPDDKEATARIAADLEIEFHDEHVFLDGRDVSDAIRAEDVNTATPHIAAYPEVRAAMVARQRELFAAGGFVAEGRDTGTVVAPEAPLKIYLTASPEERARRRARETGEDVAAVKVELENRDRLDEEREMSALRVAEDAVVLDTTGHSVEEVVDEIATLARERGIA